LAVTLARWLTAEQAIYPAADSALTTSHLGAALSVSPFLSVSASKPFVSLILPTPTPAVSPLGSMFAPTPDGDIRTVRVPILMYHYLSTPPADANIYRRDLSVAPELFAQHLERIQLEGYTTTSLYDLLLHLTQGAALPPHPVILTFDDGYRDNYEYAFPLLVKHRMQATFFVVTDFIDEQRSEYLTWDMVREMYSAGMSIESHGRNHASLQDRDDDYLIWQALGSLETIQFELGVRPHFVSYPAGEYDQRTIDIFRSAHFWAGLTTKQGATHTGDDLFQLHRVRVRGSTTPDELARLLALDW
jgi:peptidoglycan/xylan/chitin deacetylase (PgdA/CDA1 family)